MTSISSKTTSTSQIASNTTMSNSSQIVADGLSTTKKLVSNTRKVANIAQKSNIISEATTKKLDKAGKILGKAKAGYEAIKEYDHAIDAIKNGNTDEAIASLSKLGIDAIGLMGKKVPLASIANALIDNHKAFAEMLTGGNQKAAAQKFASGMADSLGFRKSAEALGEYLGKLSVGTASMKDLDNLGRTAAHEILGDFAGNALIKAGEWLGETAGHAIYGYPQPVTGSGSW